MQQPLTIVQTTANSPDPADTDKHPWRYPIPYAHKRVYPLGTGLVAEQCYDAKLLYLHQIELSGNAEQKITMEAGQTDLYWLYVLQGTLIIAQKGQTSIVLRQQHAYLLQLPAGQYQILAPDGRCLWFYFCYRKSWLLRYRDTTLRSFSSLFEKLAIPESLVLLDLTIDPQSAHVMRQLFQLREKNPIYLEQQVTRHCLHLLFTFRQTVLNLQHLLPSSHSLLTSVQQFCHEQIQLGYVPKLRELEELHQRSAYKLSKSFKKVYGINLQQYITHLRMEEAKRLIVEEELTPSEAAYQMGYYDPTAFRKAFRKHFGFNPSELPESRKGG